MSQLCALLARLGVSGATVYGPQKTIVNNIAQHRYSLQLPSTMGSAEFDEKVGFRHCVQKQALNSAAAVYRRLHQRHVAQRTAFIALLQELRAAGHDHLSALQQAQDKMRTSTDALDETAIQLSDAELQQIEANTATATNVHPNFPAFETVLHEIGAIDMFTNGVSRGKGISPLLLSVASVRPAGEREVYDISVPTLGSFTANGIVVHNCDNKFHTEPLNELLQSDDRFGFIIVDGNGVLFGTLSGNTREVIHRMTVDLPKKHGRGGQSALRFARLRVEKRHNYLRKVTELATQFFITNDRPNVAGLVLAGSADFKTELNTSDMFDPRLQTKVVAVVDIAYGGDAGFNQAIELASEVLANVKFIQEKKLITKYFEEISQDTGKYVFGVEETLRALEMGAIETLIVWENLDITRYTLRSPSSGETKIVHLNTEQAKESSHFIDPATGNQYDVETIPLVEWLANNYKKFGCQLEFITNRSQEGSQFCRGFGGIGGLLRYKVEFELLADNDDQDDDFDMEDFI